MPLTLHPEPYIKQGQDGSAARCKGYQKMVQLQRSRDGTWIFFSTLMDSWVCETWGKKISQPKKLSNYIFQRKYTWTNFFLKDSLALLSYQSWKKICFLSQNLCKIQACFLGLDVLCLAYTCLCYGFNNRALDTLVILKTKIHFQIIAGL